MSEDTLRITIYIEDPLIFDEVELSVIDDAIEDFIRNYYEVSHGRC